MTPFRYTPIGHWLRSTPQTTPKDRALVILFLGLLALAIALVIVAAVLLHAHNIQPFGTQALL